MKKLLGVALSLLTLSGAAANGALAEESFRIQRGAPPSAPAYDSGDSGPAPAPSFRGGTAGSLIQGGVERSDMQGFADNFNGNGQQGQTGSKPPLAGGVSHSDMQAFADQQAPPNLRPMNGMTQDNLLRGQADQRTLSGGVTQMDLKNLARHDVVLVIDKSGSMNTPDCPGVGSGSGLASLGLGSSQSSTLLRMLTAFGGVNVGALAGGIGMSRWEWCGAQTAALAQQYESAAPNGLSVVLFSTGTKIFPNVKVGQIPRIFTEFRPGGITNEATALRQTLGDYFDRRSAGSVKPLLVAVITDGEPTDKGALVQTLAQAMTQLRRPDEIKLTFLQVGNTLDGSDFVDRLERQFPIVSSKNFAELQRSGLTRALVDCITQHQPRYN